MAAQPGSVLQLIGQVQHVHFLVAGLLWQFIVILQLEDQVAGGAGKCSLAGAESIQVYVIIHHYVQERVTDLAFGLYPFTIRSEECDGDPTSKNSTLGRFQGP